MRHRYRNWCFTAYNEPKKDILTNDKNITFCIYQKEKCPTTNQIHWQGYVEFNQQLDLLMVKEIFKDNTLHLEQRKGSQKQAIAYCKKAETQMEKPIMFGLPKGQGHRTDLDEIMEDMEEGSTCKEILLKHKGNALRHINHIIRGLEVLNDRCDIDNYIMGFREHNALLKDMVDLSEKATQLLNQDSAIINMIREGAFSP